MRHRSSTIPTCTKRAKFGQIPAELGRCCPKFGRIGPNNWADIGHLWSNSSKFVRHRSNSPKCAGSGPDLTDRRVDISQLVHDSLRHHGLDRNSTGEHANRYEGRRGRTRQKGWLTSPRPSVYVCGSGCANDSCLPSLFLGPTNRLMTEQDAALLDARAKRPTLVHVARVADADSSAVGLCRHE